MEETRRLPYLRTGDVFISSASMGRTIFARIRAAITSSPHTENPFDELKNKEKEDDEKFFNIIKTKLPVMETDLTDLITEIEKEFNITFTVDSLSDRLKILSKKGLISRQETILGIDILCKA